MKSTVRFSSGVASKFDDIMHNMGDKPKIRIIRMRKVPFMDIDRIA